MIAVGIILFSVLYNVPKFFELSTSYELCYFNKSSSIDIQTLTYSSRSCEYEFYNRNPNERYSFFENETKFTHISDNVTDHKIKLEQSVMFYRYEVRPLSIRLNTVYVQFYLMCLNILINGILPFTLVIVLNILILMELLILFGLECPKTIELPGRY